MQNLSVRLFRHHGFEVGATVGAHCWHVGWQPHSENLQQAGVLFILVHVDTTQSLWRGLMGERI